MDDAAGLRLHDVVAFKLDRAFRSVKHMHNTLSAWEGRGGSQPHSVSFRPDDLGLATPLEHDRPVAQGHHRRHCRENPSYQVRILER